MMENDAMFMGIDLGSSFIKMTLINAQQEVVKTTKYPQKELQIESVADNWAEQDPQVWWKWVKTGLQQLFPTQSDRRKLKGIGICYQMHGLVIVDKELKPIRKSIIWCDGRTAEIGETLNEKIKEHKIDQQVLNHPSNFTLSKLVWVKENEPSNFERIYKFMLPGDYIAMKITGQCCTTETGLSEGIMWNFQENKVSQQILHIAGISSELIPKIVKNFSIQGYSSPSFMQEFDFPQSIPICYRSGDQPNNAYSLGVLDPGDVAATAGTSGVIYAVTDQLTSQEKLKFNSFLHVNSTPQFPRIGKLLCINGCGRVYQWVRDTFVPILSYNDVNNLAEQVQQTQVLVMPFGNGLERMLSNKPTKCQFKNISFNQHKIFDIIRGTVEGVAFSFVYGAELMRKEGIQFQKIKAGKGNMFESKLFCQVISSLLGIRIQIYDTIGAVGCARAALCTLTPHPHTSKWEPIKVYEPMPSVYLAQKYKIWQQSI